MRFPGIATHQRPVCFIFGLVFLIALTSSAEDLRATIRASGTQGDLVQVSQDGKEQALRLYGVACPISGQPMSESATTRILEAAMDAPVTVEIVGKDSSGTPVAWVRLPDGTSLNEQLLREGLAWWDSPNTPDDHVLQKATSEAISARRGLWATEAPLAPWDYRASHGLPEVKYEKPATESTPSKTKTVRPAVVPSLKARGEKDDDDDDGEREHARGKGDHDKDGGREHMRRDKDDDDDDGDDKAGGKDDDDDKDEAGEKDDDDKGETQGKGDYFPEDPAEHMALMLKHQPRIAFDKAGKPLGLTATDIASVPGAHRVGLQDGDIVSTVNGIALTDEAQVLGLVTQLQGVKQLDLTVIRQGKPTKITVPLE